MRFRRHTVVLTALLSAGLAGCGDDTPGALDSDTTDHAAATRVWRDPWVAPTAAMVAGPGLGTNGWVTRVVGGRTTPYAAAVQDAAEAELAVAAEAGWSPTSSACADDVRITLAGPEGALASLTVTLSSGGSEVRVAALTRHHLDDDWEVPETVTETCLDGPTDGLVELPESSEPLRSAALPEAGSVGWEVDEPRAVDTALLDEVNADLAAKALTEVPRRQLRPGENWRPAPGSVATVEAVGLAELGTLLEGWTLTWTACGGGSPVRATYVRSFEHGPAVAYATLLGGKASVRFTLPVVEGPEDDAVADLAALDSSPCLGEVDELTVAGTPAVLPTELTPIAD